MKKKLRFSKSCPPKRRKVRKSKSCKSKGKNKHAKHRTRQRPERLIKNVNTNNNRLVVKLIGDFEKTRRRRRKPKFKPRKVPSDKYLLSPESTTSFSALGIRPSNIGLIQANNIEQLAKLKWENQLKMANKKAKAIPEAKNTELLPADLFKENRANTISIGYLQHQLLQAGQTLRLGEKKPKLLARLFHAQGYRNKEQIPDFLSDVIHEVRILRKNKSLPKKINVGNSASSASGKIRPAVTIEEVDDDEKVDRDIGVPQGFNNTPDVSPSNSPRPSLLKRLLRKVTGKQGKKSRSRLDDLNEEDLAFITESDASSSPAGSIEEEKKYPDEPEKEPDIVEPIVEPARTRSQGKNLSDVFNGKKFQKKLRERLGKGTKPKLEALYGSQIDLVLDKYRPEYVGIFTRDEVKDLRHAVNKVDRMFCVYNTARSTDEPGDPNVQEHWIGLGFDFTNDKAVYHFDPLGEPCPLDVQHQIKDVIDARDKLKYYLKFKENRVRRQKLSSVLCGYHVIRWIEDMMAGKDWKECSGFKNEDGEAEKVGENMKRFGYI